MSVSHTFPWGRRAVALAVLAVCVLAGAGLTATATARSSHRATTAQAPALKMIWGPLTMPNGSSAFPVYHQLGVQVYQVQLSWAETAVRRPANPTSPTDPAYVWPTGLDRAVQEASQYGIAVALLVKGTPRWANGNKSAAFAPSKPADYANFLIAASRHYTTVHDWMIWGETTRAGNFFPMPVNSPVGPRRYAILLDAAYGALKSVSNANTVIGGMTYTVGQVSPNDFVRWLRLPNGQPPRMDDWGHNPYSTRFPDLAEKPYAPGVRDINDIDTLHNEIGQAYRGRTVPKLWLSEFGISSDHPNKAFDYYVSRPVQARWLTAAFHLADSVPYVAGLGWYELLDEPSALAGNLTEGLMTGNATPKPAFFAYQKAP
jgi:hypothetical protein